MDRALAIRAFGFYAPAVAACLLAFLLPRSRRLFAACLVGFAWAFLSLFVVQLLNIGANWWRFHADGGLFRSMPLDLLLGWAILWGVIPVLAFRRMGIQWIVTIFVAIDLVLMPACEPVVELGGRWLVGELVALGMVLVPAQLFARWTLNDTHLRARAVFHVLACGGIFLLVVPEAVFALRPGSAWEALRATPQWLAALELQAIALAAAIGVSAVQEFAQRGGGTPIPYDPPKRLVVSGLYAYIANPMQFSLALVMAGWGGALRNPWVVAAGAMAVVYGLGLASWDEGEDMPRRFGAAWEKYRRNVHPWRLRLKPWHDPDSPPGRLYVAETCGPCSEVRRWFESHQAVGLEIVAAEDHPTRDLRRITFDPMDGSNPEEGVRAVARGLEHIHVGWALAGACLRLPGISHFVQLLLDVSGLGPSTIPRRGNVDPV